MIITHKHVPECKYLHNKWTIQIITIQLTLEAKYSKIGELAKYLI